MKEKMRSRTAVYYFGIMALLLLVAACSSTPKTTDGSDAKEKDDKSVPLYYDFGDVLIPRELELDVNSSFVYHTSGFTAGILAFKSKAELGSMVNFFENNMAKDNWQAVGTFRSPRTLLLFQKENRWCVINITDNRWDTLVEIWVAPFSDISGSGLLR
ncbi:MAG: hypothetical protein ACERKP_09760 [Deltaproteobacteria bacterium]